MEKFYNFKAKLKASLVKLPGLEAQLKMAPITRLQELQKQAEHANPRKSAVLILFYPSDGRIMCALMKRPTDESVHSGQVSFPGGKFENSDKNLQETALREANEEMGIIESHVEVIGELSKLYIPPSNFDVHPFIGFSKKRPDYVLSETEVELLIEVDIEVLLNPETFTTKNISHRNRKLVDVPCFYFDKHIVWGATAMIISELIWVIKAGKSN